MQANIVKARCRNKWRGAAGDLPGAQSRAVAAQDVIDVVGKPRLIAELKGIAMARWQSGKKPVEAVGIGMPARGKLEQDRPQLAAQRRDGGEEALGAGAWILQLLHVRDISAGLAGEHELLWCPVAPCGDGLLRRQAIESAVDLDRIEPLGVEGQKVLRLGASGINRANPVRVVPSRSADPQPRHCPPSFPVAGTRYALLN